MYTRTNTYVSIFSVILQTYSACLLHPARGRDRDRHRRRQRTCVREKRAQERQQESARERERVDRHGANIHNKTYFLQNVSHSRELRRP